MVMSSFLLFIALANIGGSQSQVEFSQSVRDFESQMNDIVNDVPTGFFPSNDGVVCQVLVLTDPDNRPRISAGSGDGLGRNEECIHVGKALHFAPDGDESMLRVYTLAGRRSSVTGAPVQTVNEARPVAVADTSDGSFPSTFVDVRLQHGMRVDRILNADTSTNTYGIVAVLANFAGSSPLNAVSEGQSVQIGGINGSSLGLDTNIAVNTMINALDGDPALNPGGFAQANGGLVLCLTDDTGRIASLTIGAQGSATGQLAIGNYDTRCN